MSEMILPFVSIVICTYNRKKLLEQCVDSILAMSYPKSNYEIIIVDGGSNDGTEKIQQLFPQIRFVVEKQFGLAHARNKGAELSRGSIVAYTDDDCIVDKNWLEHLIIGFQKFPNVAGVGGPIFPAPNIYVPKKIHVSPALGLLDLGVNTRIVQVIITSNAAFRREIFDSVQFDENLGTTRRGKLILCGEDVDFCREIAKINNKLIYVPNAKVFHQIGKKRLRVSYIVKHAAHKGISMAKEFRKSKNSRIWMVRLAVGGFCQSLLSLTSDRSFSTCYKIIVSTSALFVCINDLDKFLL